MDGLIINLLILLIAICILGLLWYKGKKNLFKKIILYLVIEEEKNWGSGTGKIKFAEVMASAYERMPLIIRFFVTTDTLTKWIEDAVTYIKNEDIEEYARTNEQEFSK